MAVNPTLSAEEVRKMVMEYVAAQTEHACYTCEWCQFRKGEKPENRLCRYPEKNTVDKNGICEQWKLEPHPERRIKRFT